MLSYSQRDSRWAGNKLGQSSLTIGRYGCTTTGIADLSTYFGDNLNPDQVSRIIKYTTQGYILWDSCQFPKFAWWFRDYKRDDTKIKNALADPDTAVLLQVQGNHWVVATGKALLGGYKIADPWFGDFPTTARYGHKITGASFFRRK